MKRYAQEKNRGASDSHPGLSSRHERPCNAAKKACEMFVWQEWQRAAMTERFLFAGR
jgi:hypothetical protein